jgi:hypothetical protein
MKYLVASDIHGNEAFINYLYQLVDIEKPDKIILLGDLVSLGDASRRMIDFLQIYKDILVAIRGNMDYPISDGLLNFYQEVINGKTFIFTHGHLLSPNTFPCDVYVQGHTHMNMIDNGNPIIFNPGSLAMPRGNTVNSYGLITDDELLVKDTDGNVIKQLKYR